MRRHWLLRAVAMVMALWLPLTLGEPGAVHICRAHGSAPAETTHAGHEHGSAHSSSRQGPTAPGHHHATCTCLGCCSPSAFGAVLPSGGSRVPAAVIVADSSIPGAALRTPRAAPARFLPFANGPPVIVTAA